MNNAIPAIQIDNLRKTFHLGLRRKRVEALDGLSLRVAAGEVFGFLGPNGAGKTTTIKMLVGLLRPDRGTAALFGQSILQTSARRRLAYLPELPDFYDYLTPGEFLAHCGRLAGLEPAALARKIPVLLERVGLSPTERRQLRKFSKGMLQRVGIAQTMLADPDLYILDEPMGGLDPLGRRWVKDLILELRKGGKTIFFSSHVLAEAEAVCDRVAFLQRGRLIAEGSIHDVLRSQSDAWEVIVEGEAARTDPGLAPACARVEPAGPDTLLVPANLGSPDDLLRLLLTRSHRILSVNRRHASLEDVFIKALKQSPAGQEH